MNGKKKFLKHYGIPGMKWGIRRNREGANAGGKRKISNDRLLVNQLLKKKRSELSDSELNTIINRLTKESQVKNLSKKPPSMISNLLKDAGKATVRAGTSFGIDKLIDRYAKGDSDKEKAVRMILESLKQEFSKKKK